MRSHARAPNAGPESFATARAALAMVLLASTGSGCSKHPDSTAPGSASATSTASTAAGAEPPASGGSGTSFGTGFEGSIAMHTTSAHGAADIVFLTKGGKLRVDVPGKDGQTAHGIVDPAAKKLTILMDTQKLAMQMPIPDATTSAAAAAKAGKVTRTGKHETVAGYDCEDWDITHDTGKHESACVAQGLSFFDLSTMAGSVGGVSPSWVDELRDKGGFPLRAIETDPAGKEISRMEVTKIERKTLDEAAFTVPAAYHLMQMPSMAGGPGHGGQPDEPVIPGMPRKRHPTQ